MKHVIRAAHTLHHAAEIRAAGTKRPGTKAAVHPDRSLLDDLDELRLDLLTGRK